MLKRTIYLACTLLKSDYTRLPAGEKKIATKTQSHQKTPRRTKFIFIKKNLVNHSVLEPWWQRIRKAINLPVGDKF